MYCVHCGTEARPLDKFCRECGAKQIEATPVSTVSAEPQAATQPPKGPLIRESFLSDETPPSRSHATLITSAALVFVAAILLALFASPYITLWRIQSAVNAGNAAALNRFVAWEALRTDVKAEMRALTQTLAQREATSSDDWAAAALVGPAISDALVDTLVTAENVARLMDFYDLGFLENAFATGFLMAAQADDGVQADWNAIHEIVDYSYGYVSLDVFELRVTVKPEESEPGLPLGRLLLTRSGLGWVVSGIRFATDAAWLVEADDGIL